MHQDDGQHLVPPSHRDRYAESDIRWYGITLLRHTLACTVELRFPGQTGWHVTGHDGGPLHALCATRATALEASTALVAARLVVLGGVVCGTTRAATRQSTLSEYPDARMEGPAHVQALAE